MQFDVWYELAVRALSAGDDTVSELVRQAEAAAQTAPDGDANEEDEPPA